MRCTQLAFEFAVDRTESSFCEQAASDGGLVGDYDDGITGLVEACNGFSGARDELELFHAVEVVDLDIDCAVAVDECCGLCVHRLPLVEGMPLILLSRVTACRRDRATALKMASMPWCALLPRMRSMCRFKRALCASAVKNSRPRAVGNAPMRSSANAALIDQVRASREIDYGAGEGFVHGDVRRAESRDAGFVAQCF